VKYVSGILFFLILFSVSSAMACTLTVFPVPFGIYDPFNSIPQKNEGKMLVDCTALPNANEIRYTIQIDAGQFSKGIFSYRRMMRVGGGGGGYPLSYNIYIDSAGTQIWGDGTQGTLIQSGIGNVVGEMIVYGRTPARQKVQPGTYADAVTVRLDF